MNKVNTMDTKKQILIRSHKDLDVWKKSIELVNEIYKISKLFPVEEKYGLTSQIRRAAVSVPSNIAEGFGRNKKHPRELILFLYYSQGSLSEIETLLEVCKQLGCISTTAYDNLNFRMIQIRMMLSKLIKSKEK